MVDGQNFVLTYENQKNDLISEIDEGRKQQQTDNIEKLVPIIRAVMLNGGQGLALRGHRNSGPLLLKMPMENDGNFRAFLRYTIVYCDENLANHQETAKLNATYIDLNIQHEIIDAAGKLILMKFIKRVNEAKRKGLVATLINTLQDMGVFP